MKSNAVLILLVIVIFFDTIKSTCRSFFNSNFVKSKIDGNTYSVVSSYDDQQEAADIIAHINQFAIDVIKNLKETYMRTELKTPEQIKGFEVTNILEIKYSPKSLSENEPTSHKDTSYTQNKGEIISLCLREKSSGKNNFHSLDIIKFVMLHELAHIITPEIHHSDLFWTNFRFLLEFCERKGLYKSPDYGSKHEVYCGMTIRYNPIYDNFRTISYFNK